MEGRSVNGKPIEKEARRRRDRKNGRSYERR